ncbi:MAG: TraB/GumN family protein [Pseudomonadota bacterium]
MTIRIGAVARRTGRRALAGLLLALFPAVPALATCAGNDRLAEIEAAQPGTEAALAEAALEHPYAEGRFWRVERDGAVSWLFGTYHDPAKEIVTLPTPVSKALDSARIVLLEALQADQNAMQAYIQANPTLFFTTGGSTLDRLDPKARGRLEALLGNYSIPPEVAGRMQPWFLSILISIPACTITAAQQGLPVLDETLERRAIQAGTEVAALEELDDSIGRMARLDEFGALDVLQATIVMADASEDFRATAVRLYLEGRIRMIWEYNLLEAQAFDDDMDIDAIFATFERELLIERNRAWMARILEETAAGDAFIGVGALHLSGESGLLRLLEDAGYTVTRQTL